MELAVVGMAARFPTARDLDELWHNLSEGREAISFFSDEELLQKGLDAKLLQDPDYVKAEAVLEDIELFDAGFFGFTAREAMMMDPQHRLFLEEAWKALEHGGYDALRYRGRIGVFAGESFNSYLLSNLYPNRELMESVGGFQTIIGNDRDYLATHVSYKLNLKGPGITVQTACSTSLVAIHLACQSLLNGECDMALSGGVSISVPQGVGAMYQEGGIISPDGHCRAFDKEARGTVKGSGVGVVLLKRLADALKDGDTIHAVIKGSAINNDGDVKVGFTAPSVEGQASVIAEALAMSSVEAETIGYVEAHGTGTPLGDPIEIAALTQAFRASTGNKKFCAVGSLKTNIGHTDAAAGVAGLLKTVLALKHKQLPPSLNFSEANPNIDFASSPFYVNTKLRDWPQALTPRRAGVSSFGIGGTNAHVILEEAPRLSRSEDHAGSVSLLTLSAKTETALRAAAANLAAHLKSHEELELSDAACTLQLGRREFAHRLAFACKDKEQAIHALETLEAKSLHRGFREQERRPVIFMFTGQGSQYVSMGRGLYETEATFRHHVDHCAAILKEHLGFDIREAIYPSAERAAEAAAQLNETRITQPALFVVEYALAKLWMEWGVQPSAMIGHSLGEYTAACLSGIFSLEDALKLIATRGRLMQELPAGAMLAVPLSEDELKPLLGAQLSLAAVNAPSLSVISGTVEAIEQAERELAGRDIICRRLHTSHALHSEMMEPAVVALRDTLESVELNPPRIPIISTLTGKLLTAEEARDASYWMRQARQTVRFSEALNEILHEPESVLLEIGPGQTLCALAKQQGNGAQKRVALSSLRHPNDGQADADYLLNTLARLWTEGVAIDWRGFNTHRPQRRVPLPTYPFERQRYWIDPPDASKQDARTPDLLRRKEELADYFYVPTWRRAVMPEIKPDDESDAVKHEACWLIFNDPCGIGVQVARRLEQAGEFVINVMLGEQFDKLGERVFVLNPVHRGGYASLMKEIRALGKSPRKILHLWGVTPAGALPDNYDVYDESQNRGFYSLLALAQEFGEYGMTETAQLAFVSNNMQEVTGEEQLWPEKATALGACKVIPLEYPFIKCRSIDISLPANGTEQEARIAENLIAEFSADVSENVVAYRGRHRWLQDFEPLALYPSERTPRLRERGVYLLTGGMDEIGSSLALHLAETAKGARLVLLADETAADVDEARELEELGAEVLLMKRKLSSRAEVSELLAEIRNRFGSVNGVIHSLSVTGGGMIQLKTREMASSVLAPKVLAALFLQSALQDEQLDFFISFSTSLALTGVFGQVDYCAANAFLDHFAQAKAHESQTLYASINWHLPQWEMWQESLMASVPQLQEQFAETREKFGLTREEGVEAFRRVLSASQPQVIVSAQDFKALLAEQQAAAGMSLLDQLDAAAMPARARSEDDGDYVAPEGELEKAVASVWGELFGIQRVSATDNFFEMGGNSLLAIQLISRLRKELELELPLNTLFEWPTVEGLAGAIVEIQGRAREAEEIERLLKEIESLSPEELQATLARELEAGHENLDG
ncbi:MAG: SDR family NAD(P)-dependent oxidoreductase [Acidobacteria bacterium]|nr:SDR family NAD(P)-dependent oxidoreductase [Acidobacteriota bacterium]